MRRESFVSAAKTTSAATFERGVAEADVVVEAEYRTQVVLHNSMETHQAVCHWEDDGITIYISTQYIWGIRDAMAEQLGLPPDKVRVVCHAMGGGFGSKNGPGDYTPIAAELAKTHGPSRQVRADTARGEHRRRQPQRDDPADHCGERSPTERSSRSAATSSTRSASPAGRPPPRDRCKMLYACDNVRTVQYPAKLNLPPMAAFRAPGFVEGTFALECLLDELAAKLDLDPLELRRRNYAGSDRVDDRPSRRRTSRSATGARSRTGRGGTRCARAATDRGSTASASRPRSGTAAAARRRTRGSASAADGRAQVVTAMQDIGTGTRTAMAQIAAEELGIPFEHVQVSLGDSARGPFASISAGSSTIPSMGPAVRSAAADAKRQLLEIAAQRFHLEERVLD